MTFGRRDLIKFATGGACGVALTPVPWKLLDDSANWSQNWARTPKVPRGERTVKFSTCTLCPAGCGVKAECVAGRAVAIVGAVAHPASHGVLCPAGIAGHTAAYHPRRLRQPRKGKSVVTVDAAVKEIAARVAGGAPVAILDLGPERAMSTLHRDAAEAFGDALYLRPADAAEATLNAAAELAGRAPGSLGLDLEHTKTLISFGAPVLERWATPGRVMERWRTGELHIVQFDARQSRTALAAQNWILMEPGTGAEAASSFARSGHPELKIEEPAVAVGSGGGEEHAVAALNVALGAVGRAGGIVARSAPPWKPAEERALSAVPDHSIGVLFVDLSRSSGTVPWPAIQRKLAEGAMVVALAWREDALTEHASFMLPVAAPFESMEDAGAAPCAAVPSFSVASPLIEVPAVHETPVDRLNAVLRAVGKTPLTAKLEDVMKERSGAIYAAKKGTVVAYSDGAVTKVAELASADDLWKKLLAGACWMGEPSTETLRTKMPVVSAAASTHVRDENRPFTLLVYDSPDDTSPLMTKLYQESGLYTLSALARLNPETAARMDVKSGMRVVIETAHGSSSREALVDPAVRPGVVEVAAGGPGADITDISTDGLTSEWRIAPANVRRA